MNRQVTLTDKEAKQLAFEIAKLMKSHLVDRRVKPNWEILDEALRRLSGKTVTYFK